LGRSSDTVSRTVKESENKEKLKATVKNRGRLKVRSHDRTLANSGHRTKVRRKSRVRVFKHFGKLCLQNVIVRGQLSTEEIN